jgi:hypothetical protein
MTNARFDVSRRGAVLAHAECYRSLRDIDLLSYRTLCPNLAACPAAGRARERRMARRERSSAGHFFGGQCAEHGFYKKTRQLSATSKHLANRRDRALVVADELKGRMPRSLHGRGPRGAAVKLHHACDLTRRKAVLRFLIMIEVEEPKITGLAGQQTNNLSEGVSPPAAIVRQIPCC